MSTDQQPSAFDLEDAAKITAREDEGVTVPLRDLRTGDLTGSTVHVVGSYSQRFIKARDARINRRLRAAKQGTPSAEDLAANQVELVADCILGWDNILSAGQPYPFTREHAIALLTKAPWVRDQLEVAMDQHAAFFGASASS